MDENQFDIILENRIQMGCYQWTTMFWLLLVQYANGNLIVFSTIFNPMWKVEFDMTSNEYKFSAALSGAGCMIGCLVSSRIALQIGRYNTIVLAMCLNCIFGFSVYWITSQFGINLARFLLGFSQMLSMSLSPMCATEISTMQYRGKFTVIQNYFLAIGKVGACVTCIIFMTNFTEGNWRIIFAIMGVVSLITAIGIKICLLDSPRFLLAIGWFDHAFSSIDLMLKYNNGDQDPQLSNEQREDIQAWAIHHYHREDETQAISELDIFQGELGWITLQLWMVFYSIICCFYGLKVISPIIFDAYSMTMYSILLQTLGELFSVFITLPLIDNPRFGRQGTMFVVQIANMMLYSYGTYLISIKNIQPFEYLAIVMTMFSKAGIGVFTTICTEKYPTLYRNIGYSWGQAYAFGTLIYLPFLLFSLFEIREELPIAFFVLSCILSLTATCFVRETLGRNLEGSKLEKTNNEEQKPLLLNEAGKENDEENEPEKVKELVDQILSNPQSNQIINNTSSPVNEDLNKQND